MTIFYKRLFARTCANLFVVLLGSVPFISHAQQLSMYDFVLFGGNGSCPAGPGQQPPLPPGCAVLLGSTNNVSGEGAVGSYSLIRTTGSNHIIGNLHSGGTIALSSKNIVNGKITAANTAGGAGAVLAAGSHTNISGNIDVNGDVIIVGGWFILQGYKVRKCNDYYVLVKVLF